MLIWASALETAALNRNKNLSYESHHVKMLHILVLGWIDNYVVFNQDQRTTLT